eukprot:819724-Pelagomonas_calceolata.AAC.1
MKHISTPMSQPHSQNNPEENAGQSTAIYIPTQPNSTCTTDTGQIGNTCSPSTCPNTSHSLGTQINNHKNKKEKVLHTMTELNPPVIKPPQLALPRL